MRGIQSALEPAGVHADRIGSLWDLFLIVTAVIYVLVLIAVLMALRHRPQATGSRHVLTTVIVATGITVVTLFTLLVASVSTGRELAFSPKSVVQITVTAHQWWWQVEYDDDRGPYQRITTANELTIPVGVPVRVYLRSTDVIHSFWVPNLHGKQDLIPGKDNAILLRATRPGVFRGQCAEFCGYQHAKMAFWVTALPRAEFAKWADSQRQSSKIPSTPSQRKGQEVFVGAPCAICHTIRGTDASGKAGPDLTHIGSRRSIAAGTLPNVRGNLAGWILDPQHIKPGAYMPPIALREGELDPLLDYLESLQ